jgi:hypothetical protein
MKTTTEVEVTNAIMQGLEDPKQLEMLYQQDKSVFKRVFNHLYPDIQLSLVAKVWHERLNCVQEEISWGTNTELLYVILASIVAAIIAKVPVITGVDPEYFYQRNVGFIIFPLLTGFFAWKRKTKLKKVMTVFLIMTVSLFFINILSKLVTDDTVLLACIHLPLFLWSLMGFIFISDRPDDYSRRLDFLKYNGDLLVMTAIILIAGAILTFITLGLFTMAGLPIVETYFNYVVIGGLAAAPVFGTYLVQVNPLLVNKVSPIIARVFTPLVFVTLVAYLIAIVFAGKDPFTNRDFLIVFNLMLIGVMALILFSVTEMSKATWNKPVIILLTALAVVAIIVNGVALSAIVYRISEWGITPNRLAVLGGNILILIHLLWVTTTLFKTLKSHQLIVKVEKGIVLFLPIYGLWTFTIVFFFPLLFNMFR